MAVYDIPFTKCAWDLWDSRASPTYEYNKESLPFPTLRLSFLWEDPEQRLYIKYLAQLVP